MSLPLWFHWILLGLVAGTLAKFLMPGRDPSGCVFTTLLGVLGAFVGGLAGTAIGWGHITQPQLDLRSIGIATAGAMVVLLLGRIVRRL